MSQAAEDSANFNSLAVGRATLNNDVSSPPSSSKPVKSSKEQKVGEFVQYSRVGPGFLPTPATVHALEPSIYHVEYCDAGPIFVPHRLVTDHLLRLPDSKSDFVISEIERFWTLKELYTKFGLTYKRGFLLYGPPGSGKTCTVDIIVKQMVDRGGVVLIANTEPSDVIRLIMRFRQVENDRPIIVILEDIDAYIKRWSETQVLSILDGEDSVDNVVYIATTNYPENLDARVINRPSRFDRVVHIGTPNAAARKLYLESRKTGLSDEEMNHWVAETDGFSISHLKELVIGVVVLGGALEDEVERLRSMAKTPRSDDGKAGVGFGAGAKLTGFGHR